VKGYIHVYTGDGKGKTTAALGIALRAICAGKKVFFGQFVKGNSYSESHAKKVLPSLEITNYGREVFIRNQATEEEIRLANEGLQQCEKVLKQGDYDVVILDELNIALYYRLFPITKVLEILKNKAEHVEVIITGRKAPQKLIDAADLVTEMKEIKHYYQQGVVARLGIDK